MSEPKVNDKDDVAPEGPLDGPLDDKIQQACPLDDQIQQALAHFNEYHDLHHLTPSPDIFEYNSPSTSVSSAEDTNVNLDTVASLKRSMTDTSRLITTFTTLKTTYLKLCTEFNYLLGKFNENEKLKVQLIHENNELRRVLAEVLAGNDKRCRS